MEKQLLLYFAGILALGISAQWLAWRLRVPSILLLLGFGFLAGFLPGALGWVSSQMQTWSNGQDIGYVLGAIASFLPASPDDVIPREVLFPIVSLSVAVILFEGGMSLRLAELREVGSALGALVSVGAVITWVLGALFAWLLIGFSPAISIIVGAILVVTGPTVVGPMLSHIRPSRKIGSLAKWEGIVIDPIGAVLAVLVFEFFMGSERGVTWLTPMASIGVTILVGVALGLFSAQLIITALKGYWIPDALHNAFTLATVLLVFAISNIVQSESGLLTVTVLGLRLANQREIPVRHIFEFKENLRVLLISCLFIVLAARIPVADLLTVGWSGLWFVVVLIVVVRPVSVFLSTLNSGLSFEEKVFLCFMAPRGIVAAAVGSIFSFELVHAGNAVGTSTIRGLPEGTLVVPVVFLVIVGTVTFYGLTASSMARVLKLASPSPQGILFAGADRWIREVALVIKNAGFHVVLVDTNFRNISTARMAGLSAQCASVLSDFVGEELNLGGVGRLIAATPNDEVNSLACLEFTHLFGRKEVYQLSPWDSGSGKRTSVSDHLRGRVTFGHGLDFYKLARRVAAGAVVKKTSLTDEFTYQDFQVTHGESATLLFVITEGNVLKVVTAEDSTVPKSGQTIIALIDAKPEREVAKTAKQTEEPTSKQLDESKGTPPETASS